MPFSWAALTDEIDPDLGVALSVMAEAGVPGAELRTVCGKNVLELSDAEAEACRRTVAEAGCTVAGIAAPVGKSALALPAAREQERLERALALAALTGAPRIRVFSFYPEGEARGAADGAEVISRLRGWARSAERAGVLLVLENEVGLWADVPERCRRVLDAVASPALRFAWDPANFLRSGVERPFDAGWAALESHCACVHVKDCRRDGTHTPAGQGDGQWPELMAALRARGGAPLVMEPHLELAGHSVGFTGAARFREAVAAARALAGA